MNPKTVKKALKDAIQAMTDYKWLFSARPGKDNTRNRKFPFQKVISFILAFRGGTLNHEIMDFFGLDPSAGTSSAFIQRRSTILPEAFESLFHDFFDYLPRTSRKYDPAVFFELHFRIVRFPISDTACETIITNLDASAFPLHDIKRLYAMRWGIEKLTQKSSASFTYRVA